MLWRQAITSKQERIRVLVADDQPHVLEAVELLLKPQGIDIDCVRSPQLLLEALGERDYDVALIDLNYTRDTTSGREGLDLLASIQEFDSRLPVIVMTAWGNIDLAVESIKRGARDFIQKPWENERLVSLIRVHAELHQALRRARQLELENRLLRAEGMPDFIASAPSMQPVLELIARVGPSDANVLITGEHGTGKEIVARLLHAASPRARMPLVTVNAGGMPEGTFESEFFGHVKGAFTDARSDRVGRFELANGGTLFLDEIANVPMRQQAKLLRVLETGELERVGSSQTRRVDVRLSVRHQRKASRRSQDRQLPRRPAVPYQYGRDSSAASARPARGHPAPCAAFSFSFAYPLSQAGHRLLAFSNATDDAVFLARQCARIRAQHRARLASLRRRRNRAIQSRHRGRASGCIVAGKHEHR